MNERTSRTMSRLALMLCIASCVPMARAQAPDSIGHAANAWLALQSSNAEAAPARAMPGAQSTAAYARYMKSFDTPIPEHYGSSLENAGRPSLDVNEHGAN
jgi:hypothetical protein